MSLSSPKRVARAQLRGVTLVEVLIVVAIMALIAGGVSVYVMGKLGAARRDTACVDVRDLRRVAEGYRIHHAAASCPTVAGLLAAGELDEDSARRDPWGSPYQIHCEEGRTRVLSNGPDERAGNEDDISAPGCGMEEGSGRAQRGE